jgi:hypothetical protein
MGMLTENMAMSRVSIAFMINILICKTEMGKMRILLSI